MIVREQGEQLFLITQPHHAAISGQLAGHWKVTAFRGFDVLESVLFTIREHDRCWTNTDAAPLFNPATSQPYSFDDYPEKQKIKLYTQGLDEMEEIDRYAAWLCSRHFGAFFETAGQGAGQQFYWDEKARQDRLWQQLNRTKQDLDAAEFHFHLLQFCDNLSLFICLNEAGLDQHPWFRDGFAGSDKLSVSPDVLKAIWKNKETLMIRPFPFDAEFTIDLEYRILPTGLSSQKELDQLWKAASVQTQTIRFT